MLQVLSAAGSANDRLLRLDDGSGFLETWAGSIPDGGASGRKIHALDSWSMFRIVGMLGLEIVSQDSNVSAMYALENESHVCIQAQLATMTAWGFQNPDAILKGTPYPSTRQHRT
jgi:hypothetical protein